MTSHKDPLSLDSQLCFALYSASRALVRAYGPLLEPLGLTYPQYIVLLALWEEDGIPVGSLGERLGLDSGTLTPLLKRLEQRGIVERLRTPEDERVVRIYLSLEGKKLRTKARHIPAQMLKCTGFDGTTERTIEDLVRLREQLVTLTRRIEADETAACSD